eukprot:COSAG02_NODE_39083_length_421_cov_0.956522_1_plen_123_part_01
MFLCVVLVRTRVRIRARSSLVASIASSIFEYVLTVTKHCSLVHELLTIAAPLALVVAPPRDGMWRASACVQLCLPLAAAHLVAAADAGDALAPRVPSRLLGVTVDSTDGSFNVSVGGTAWLTS